MLSTMLLLLAAPVPAGAAGFLAQRVPAPVRPRTETPAERAPAPAAQAANEAAVDPFAQQASVILRRSRDEDGPSSEELARELTALGDGALPALLDALATRKLADVEGLPRQLLNEIQEGIVLAGLRAHPRTRVEAALEARLERTPDARTRAAAIVLHGELGGTRSLRAMLEIAAASLSSENAAEGATEALELDGKVAAALERALAGIVRREPEALVHLTHERAHLSRKLLPSILVALGRAQQPAALPLLADIVRSQQSLFVLGISQVPSLGSPPTPELGRELARELCRQLDPSETLRCQTIALALGYLEDGNSVAHLLELLEEEARGLRTNAYAALRRLSGCGFPETPALWRTWHQQESAWYVRRAPRLLRQAHGSDPRECEAALRELARHRLHRHEIALELVELLEHSRDSVRLLTCQALAELGSPRAVGSLSKALEDPSEDVREAAWSALKKITGRSLPREREAWLAGG